MSSMYEEKCKFLRKIYWTGLRPPSYPPIGYNWSTYFCLQQKTNYKCPMNNIMFIINEYLNWIPAMCWSMFKENTCKICKCGYWGGDYFRLPIELYCSYECLEKKNRNDIINEYEEIITLMKLFTIFPNDTIKNMKSILNDFSEFDTENLYSSSYDEIDSEYE